MKISTVTLYGLASCDTTRAARKWLDAHGVADAFHERSGRRADKGTGGGWVKQLGWEKVLNKAQHDVAGIAGSRQGRR